MACNRQPRQFLRFMRPKILTTRNDKLIPKLTSDVKVNYDPLNFATSRIKRLDGRLKILSNHLTDLIKFERVDLPLHKAEEVRGYTERLIAEAIRYGDCHVPTMELADFWIRVSTEWFAERHFSVFAKPKVLNQPNSDGH